MKILSVASFARVCFIRGSFYTELLSAYRHGYMVKRVEPEPSDRFTDRVPEKPHLAGRQETDGVRTSNCRPMIIDASNK